MNIFLLFPVHLFSDITNLINKKVYLIEDPRYFKDFSYHKLKIAYHRSTMKAYNDFLISHNINVSYIEFNNPYKNILEFNESNIIETYDLGDNVLKTRLIKYIKCNKGIKFIKTLNFLVDEKMIKDKFSYNSKKFTHENFYKWQRIRLNILMDDTNKPLGGKWSFDKENRKKLPNNIEIPKILNIHNKDSVSSNMYLHEAIEYTEKNFPKNYGSLDFFIYPITHEESVKWLNDFLKNKFKNFGIYEDAVSNKDPFLFHSILSPMMNIGLITDTEVITIALKYQNKIPINSFEGFIRQIIGWRNYMYASYLLFGDDMKKSNFFKHKNKLSKDIMWTGKTDILPIDDIISKIYNYGYAHHIERLMYLGNYMLLCMIEPNDVYNIFMEWTIDAYEWVMVPNVYGLSQFADGGIIMKRPYFASSNYILKMSNYKKDDWCYILNCLYYNFINTHQKYLISHYSSASQVYFWNKKTEKEKKDIINTATKYIKEYCK